MRLMDIAWEILMDTQAMTVVVAFVPAVVLTLIGKGPFYRGDTPRALNWFASAAWWAYTSILVGTSFAPDVGDVFAKAFGDTILGLPTGFAIPIISVVLSPPAWIVGRHLCKEAFWSTYQVNLESADEPRWYKSKVAVYASLAFYLSLIVGWIIYTAKLGI